MTDHERKNVKEYPILFSGEMVKASLANQKTQTRRVVNPQPSNQWVFGNNSGDLRRCPYGTIGHRLWVREAWRKHMGEYVFRADVEDVIAAGFTWKPSIHMPRLASRITLEITGVRVERLWAISEADAMAEGLTPNVCAHIFDKAAGKHEARDAAWLERESDGEQFYYKGNGTDFCYECAVKLHSRRSKSYRLCGDGGSAHETDGPAYCDKCGEATCVSLTEYGVERELRIEDDPEGKEPQYFPVGGVDARIAETLASGIGDLQEKRHGRLAQIGYATLWNQINGKDSWAANPWVWVVSFRRLP